jgi:hypothetical protein
MSETGRNSDTKRRFLEILRAHLILMHLSKLYGPATSRPRQHDSEVSK